MNRIEEFNQIPDVPGFSPGSLLILNKPRKNSINEILKLISQHQIKNKIVVVAQEKDIKHFKLASGNGTFDYVDPDNIIKHIYAMTKQSSASHLDDTSITSIGTRFNIIGTSPGITNCLKTVAIASRSNASVLIQGETGTGKELFARAIHGMSDRRNKNLIVVDCASLPANLVESMLFGYTKGAFTGADTTTDGLIVRAHNGTLFLDELSEIPFELQNKFLRLLQEKRFRPVGAKHEVESDFRLVAATNKDLSQMVSAGKYRPDLLYRIKSVTINLPPLRHRLSDLSLLVSHLIQKICTKNRIQYKEFSQEFIDLLMHHDWPGNVRELENVLESIIALNTNSTTLRPEHIPPYIRIKAALGLVGSHSPYTVTGPTSPARQTDLTAESAIRTYKEFRRSALDSLDKQYFKNLYNSTNGDIAKAMNIANLSRARLYDFYKKYNLTKREA